MFRQEREVTYSVLGPDHCVRHADILRYFQDVTVGHSQACGYSIGRLSALSCAWLLVSMCVRFDHPIGKAEKLIVSTYTTSFSRVSGFRNYRVADALDGTVYARGASFWAFVDTNTGRPRQIIPEIVDLFGTDPDDGSIAYLRRTPEYEATEKTADFRVLQRDLDTNVHMNNVKYVEYAEEALSESDEVLGVNIYYKHPAYQGDTLSLYVSRQKNKVLTKLQNQDGLTCAWVSFDLKE